MNVPVHFVCEDVTDSSQFGPLLPTYANPRIMGTVGADSIPAPLLASAGVAWPDRTHILNQGHDYLFCVSCVGLCTCYTLVATTVVCIVDLAVL